MYSDSYMLQTLHNDTSSILKEMVNSYDNDSQNMTVFIWGQNNKIVHLSNRMKNKFGLSDWDIEKVTWMDVFPASIVSDIVDHFNVSDKEFPIPAFIFDGEKDVENKYQGFVAPFLIKDDVYYVCQLTNKKTIHEWKEFIIHMERLILSSQMTASLVHEVRNPLTSLKGFLQLVQSGVEQREEYYQVIINEIEKLEHITQDLLQMSKPSISEKAKNSMENIINDVVFLLGTQTEMRNIEFNTRIDKPFFVDCHLNQMKQVFINLIKNAAEAMDKTGEIIVQAFQEQNNVHIKIIDHGKGIPEDSVEALYTPFYTTKTDGTGLGLVITNHIIKDHQGDLRVSTEENKGTVFTVVLPLLQ